jgi:hypothetical protein
LSPPRESRKNQPASDYVRDQNERLSGRLKNGSWFESRDLPVQVAAVIIEGSAWRNES